MPKQILRKSLLIIAGLSSLGLLLLAPKPALATTSTTVINFQGKVVNADGTNVTNGSYNFDFVLYDDPTLGSPSDGVHDKWHELTKSVSVTNGVFQTELGSATALPNFNANPDLYLAVRFNADAAGYMSPRIHLNTVPYAKNADALGGLAAASFVQLAQGLQTDSSTTNASIAINKTGSTANILTLQKSSTSVLTIDNGGALTITPVGNNIGTIVRQTSGTATSGSVLDVQGANGSSHFIQVTETAANAGSVSIASLGANDLTLDSGSATLKLGSNTTTLQKSATAFTLDVNNGSDSTLTVTNAGAGVASLSVEGDIAAGSGRVFKVGAASGSTISACGAGNYVGSYASAGGITTGGSCTALTVYDNGSVNGSAVTDFNFLNVAASSSVTGTTWSLDTAANPDNITIAIANATGTTAGAVTAGAQKIGGDKTLSGNTILTGTVLAQNSSNSANAFQIKNQGGSSIINVDNTKSNANNLAANSSFESAISNWSALNAGAASQSSAQAYEGTDSLLIATGTNGSGGGASYSTGSSFLANGSTYTLSAYVKTDSNLPVTTFEMGHADNGSAPTLVSCLTAQSSPVYGGWQRFSCTWTSGAITGNPFIYFKQTDAVNRNLYIDDILVQLDANADTNYRNAAINFTGAIVSGALVLQNAVNSNNALQVQNASGSTIFNVDTTDTNLIPNPDFEVNATGWSANGSATIVRSSTQSYIGSYSLKVTASTTANNGAQFSLNPIVTSTGTTYTISWYAKLDASSSAMTDMAALFSADGSTTVACTPGSGTVVIGGWTRYSCSVASGATTPSTSGFVRILQTGTTSGHIYYIDAVQLEAAALASAYGAGTVSLNGIITSPVAFLSAASTTAFLLQNTGGATLLTGDTLNGQVLLGQSSSLTGKLVFNNSGNGNTFTLQAGATGSNLSLTLPTASAGANNYCLVGSTGGVLSFLPCGAGNTASVTLTPEFIGAVMTPVVAGTHAGTMTSDFCSGSGHQNINTGVCTVSTDDHNYYAWTANATNDYDIWVRWQAPSDFSSFSSGSFNYWKTSTSDSVTVNVYNSSASTCATQAGTGTTAGWASQAITMTSCTPSAGNVITIDIHLSVGVNAEFARIGEISLTYNRN